MFQRTVFVRAAAVMIASCLLITGCKREEAKSPAGLPHVKIGWIGLVCEAPIFSAYQNGYFKDEGLDAELVHTDWDSFQAGMSFRKFDATHTLVTYLLKPIEQGLDIKITGGVHKGCLRLQAGIKTNIHTLEDFRGKRIAVSTMGGPPMIFVSRVLSAHGIDVQKEITWVVYPGDLTQIALDKGLVDGVANSEPIGSLLLDQHCVRTIVDQMVDAPYKDEFCCAVVINGPLAREHPDIAAKITRAIMRGSKWVGANPQAAAQIEVTGRYVSKADVQLNSAVLTKLDYSPAVESCRAGIDIQCVEMKAAHILNSSTDPHELARRAWLSLDGVTDQWIANVPVEHIAGMGPVHLDSVAFAALAGQHPSCCNRCCAGE